MRGDGAHAPVATEGSIVAERRRVALRRGVTRMMRCLRAGEAVTQYAKGEPARHAADDTVRPSTTADTRLQLLILFYK